MLGKRNKTNLQQINQLIEGRMYKHFLKSTLFLSLLLTNCGPMRYDKNDCGFYMNLGRRIGWSPYNLPIMFYIDPSVPKNMIPAIKKAADNWEKILGNSDLIEFTTDNPENSFMRSIVPDFVTNFNVILGDGSNQFTESRTNAKTYYTWSYPYLYKTDIVINLKDTNWDLDDVIDSNKTDLTGVMMHEFGHALGLRHNETQMDSVMYPYAGNGQKLEANETDTNNIICHYGGEEYEN